MRFLVRHTTRYVYSQPVFLEPHILRLYPKTDSWQRLSAFRLLVEPKPAGRSDFDDAFGNTVSQVWFNGLHDHLTVTTECDVELLRDNPFDYLGKPSQGLPVDYEDEAVVLDPYLGGDPAGPAVTVLAEELVSLANGSAPELLNLLTARLHTDIAVALREHGDPWDPEQTLTQGTGACRDTTALFLAVARRVGFAGRFVSGYQAGDRDQMERRELHAWPEVYLPGGGWRGYDPTLGLAVSNEHVALARGPSFREAAPVAGHFRGTGATARLEFEIHLAFEP